MKFDNITDEIIRGLPTGTILKLEECYCKETKLCMVLRGVKHRNGFENIVSGETWKPLNAVNLRNVKGIYQPMSNMDYLYTSKGNSGITTDGTETIWEEKTERVLKLEKLHKQAQDIADQIAELD